MSKHGYDRSDAKSDASDFVLENVDGLIEQLIEADEADTSPEELDECWREGICPNGIGFLDACHTIDNLEEFEETDKGLWEGCEDFRAAAEACAYYTYQNAVCHYIGELIGEVNDSDEVEELLDRYRGSEDEDEDEEDDDAKSEPYSREQLGTDLENVINAICKAFTE